MIEKTACNGGRNSADQTKLLGASFQGKNPILDNFRPQIVDDKYFSDRSINVRLSEGQRRIVRETSTKFVSDFERIGGLLNPEVERVKIDMNEELPKHGETPCCPPNMVELNPAFDACDIGCLYCSRTDGSHMAKIRIIENFPEYFEHALEKNNGAYTIYFAGAQTELFQRPLMDAGITQGIFEVFRRHLESNPSSMAKLFALTKIDVQGLGGFEKARETANMLGSLKSGLRMSGSVSIMSEELRNFIEPNSPSLQSRLEFIKLCREAGVNFKSILLQPIIDTQANEEILHTYLKALSEMGISHVKPEFLTISLQNISCFGQLIGILDQGLEKALWENRFSVDESELIMKKMERAPPQDKNLVRGLYLQVKEMAKAYGMEATLCAWAKKAYDLQDYNLEALKKGIGCMGHWAKP